MKKNYIIALALGFLFLLILMLIVNYFFELNNLIPPILFGFLWGIYVVSICFFKKKKGY